MKIKEAKGKEPAILVFSKAEIEKARKVDVSSYLKKLDNQESSVSNVNKDNPK